jgi:hypothetical protein
MARRRPAPVPVLPDGAIAVPEFLVAGCCSEVWDPDRPSVPDEFPDYAVRAMCRYRDALRAFLLTNELERTDPRLPESLRATNGCWSFKYLAEHNPQRLADVLESRQLPSDWQPTPAPKPLLTPWRYGTIPPAVAAIVRLGN